MALRALLFSKDADTTTALAAVFAECGLIVETCADIFGAVQKGTKQPYACVIVDWAEQPEAGFLLRRVRESENNRSTVPIAIVDDEPPAEQLRDHRLDFLFYRPIVGDEARSVLAKARQKMEMQSSAVATEFQIAQGGNSASTAELDDPNLVGVTAKLPERSNAHAQQVPPSDPDAEPVASESEVTHDEDSPQEIPSGEHRRINPRVAAAVLLVLVVALCFWRSRAAFLYLKTTPEGSLAVLRESIKSLFYANGSGAQPVSSVVTEAQQDAYFTRPSGADKGSQPAQVGVINAEASLPDTPRPLPRPYDFPLPMPELVRAAPTPVHAERAQIPESLRSSAPIAAPVVVTANPAQMMPVSAAIPPSQPQQFSEPVPITEEAARALAIRTVSPTYPPEAQAQKLQGTVVLQAVIGRDGSVQDLKIVRGYFLLGKAAIAAVKQWQFKPYTVNGKAAATQTSITVRFSPPA